VCVPGTVPPLPDPCQARPASQHTSVYEPPRRQPRRAVEEPPDPSHFLFPSLFCPLTRSSSPGTWTACEPLSVLLYSPTPREREASAGGVSPGCREGCWVVMVPARNATGTSFYGTRRLTRPPGLDTLPFPAVLSPHVERPGVPGALAGGAASSHWESAPRTLAHPRPLFYPPSSRFYLLPLDPFLYHEVRLTTPITASTVARLVTPDFFALALD